MTSSVVTGDCISPKTWYFHRTTVKQDSVWHFWNYGVSPVVWW